MCEHTSTSSNGTEIGHNQLFSKLINYQFFFIFIPVIRSSQRRGIISAKNRIDVMVESARQRTPFTHFISFPLNSKEIQDSFLEFKDDVLRECYGVSLYTAKLPFHQSPTRHSDYTVTTQWLPLSLFSSPRYRDYWTVTTSDTHVIRYPLPPGGFLVQRSIRGRAAEMGLKISFLV